MISMPNKLVSVVIPARTEKFLNRTIQDILNKATGEIEVIPVLDGYGDTPYEKITDPRVHYISLPVPYKYERHKRQAINSAVSISRGEYVMWIDAHCVVAKGFDEVLARDCKDDWIMVPRRYKMDSEKWDRVIEDRPPIDYVYPMWQYLKKKNRIAGYRWDLKSEARKDIMIDDIITTQGSLIFMTRKWFDKMGFMKLEGYTGWGQEGEEVCLTTILNGGRAVVNKNTWYAHLHKGQMHGRMYKWTTVEPSYEYSFNYWIHEHKDFFINLIEKNMPVPNFHSDWKEKLYGNT